MYLNMSDAGRYMQISMYLNMSDAGRYMEISMYLNMSNAAGYMVESTWYFGVIPKMFISPSLLPQCFFPKTNFLSVSDLFQ